MMNIKNRSFRHSETCGFAAALQKPSILNFFVSFTRNNFKLLLKQHSEK